MEYKRYCEWYQHGRKVRPQEKARMYLTDGEHREAVFAYDQTVPLTDVEGWELVTAADSPQPKRKKKGEKRVFMEYDGAIVHVHVGSRQDLIALLRERKFRFMPKRGRWWREATPDEVETAKRVFEKRGYVVVYTETRENF